MPPPNYPVIVVHADGGDGLTACTGQPMPRPVGDVYRNVPRYFCQACASSAASRQMAEADVVELARSLEGAEEVDTQVMSVDGFSRCVIPVNWMKRGRYLVIPLPEGEEK